MVIFKAAEMHHVTLELLITSIIILENF